MLEILGKTPVEVRNIYALSHPAGQPIRVVIVLASNKCLMIQSDLLDEGWQEIGYLVISDDVPVDPAGYVKRIIFDADIIETVTAYFVSGCPNPARVKLRMSGGIFEISADGFPYGLSYVSEHTQAGTPQFDDAEYSEGGGIR
ncbi:hypothetical protein D3C73_1142460 [compost metagenome]